VEKFDKKYVTKVYCSKCDVVCNSRKTFEKHLIGHYSGALEETCPIDTVISKFLNIIKRKSTNKLE